MRFLQSCRPMRRHHVCGSQNGNLKNAESNPTVGASSSPPLNNARHPNDGFWFFLFPPLSSFAVLTDRSMDRRPSFAVSPRPHRASAAAGRPLLASSVQTPLGSIKKAQTPMRSSICALARSCRLEPSPREKLDFAAAPTPTRAAGKENLHAHHEVNLNLAAAEAMNNWRAAPTSPLFERGRLYDLYSARRNERLKRKHGFPSGEEEAEAMAEDPCVAVELSKRRGVKKSAESVRRSMPAADFPGSRAGGLSLRSSLRSSKEMKKASAAAAKSSAVKERRFSTRLSARRI